MHKFNIIKNIHLKIYCDSPLLLDFNLIKTSDAFVQRCKINAYCQYCMRNIFRTFCENYAKYY